MTLCRRDMAVGAGRPARPRAATAAVVPAQSLRAAMREAVGLLDGDGLKRRLARGSAQALAVHACGVGLAFLAQLLLTRSLGSVGYGVYAFVFAWLTVFARFSTLGFETSLLRFVSAYREQQLWGLLKGVVRYAERRVVMVGSCLALVGGAVVILLGERVSERTAQTFLVGLLVVPLWALVRVRGSTVRAFGGVISALAPDRVVREGVLVILIGTASIGFSWTASPPWAMGAILVGTAIGLFAVTRSLNQSYSRELANDASPIENDAADWRRTALPLLISSGTAVVMNRTAVVMSGWLIDTTHAGLLALAASISLLVSFPQVAVNAMFTPTIAALYKRGDHRALQSVITTGSWWITLAALGALVPVFIFAEFILSLFGEDFTAATTALRILLLGQFANAAAGPVLQIMNMTGKENYVAAILVATMAIGIALSAILITGFGLNGGAIAAAVSLTVWNCAMATFIWWRLQLIPSVLGTVSWLRMGARHV